jgi:hypothetical protein
MIQAKQIPVANFFGDSRLVKGLSFLSDLIAKLSAIVNRLANDRASEIDYHGTMAFCSEWP